MQKNVLRRYVMATEKDCPKCGKPNILRFWIKTGYEIAFDLPRANQTIICPNCKRRISYSVQPTNADTTE